MAISFWQRTVSAFVKFVERLLMFFAQFFEGGLTFTSESFTDGLFHAPGTGKSFACVGETGLETLCVCFGDGVEVAAVHAFLKPFDEITDVGCLFVVRDFGDLDLLFAEIDVDALKNQVVNTFDIACLDEFFRGLCCHGAEFRVRVCHLLFHVRKWKLFVGRMSLFQTF